MTANSKIRFRWTLPLAQLVVCLVLLWPLAGFIVFQLQAVAHELWPARVPQPVYFLHTTPATASSQPTPAGHDHDISLRMVELRVQIPALLNFPCMFIGLARAGPAAMLSEFWRAISFPMVGIFFWWLVGRGMEALAASRHRVLSPVIRLAEVVVAALLILGNGAILFGFAVDPSIREDFIYPWFLAAAAAGLWTVLSVTIVAARIVQWRMKRRAAVL